MDGLSSEVTRITIFYSQRAGKENRENKEGAFYLVSDALAICWPKRIERRMLGRGRSSRQSLWSATPRRVRRHLTPSPPSQRETKRMPSARPLLFISFLPPEILPTQMSYVYWHASTPYPPPGTSISTYGDKLTRSTKVSVWCISALTTCNTELQRVTRARILQ